MRRKVTLSLDERFIEAMDGARGMVPRSRWIETPWSPITAAGVEARGEEAHAMIRAVERVRSPRPAEVFDPPREISRHRPTCKCPVCKPA